MSTVTDGDGRSAGAPAMPQARAANAAAGPRAGTARMRRLAAGALMVALSAASFGLGAEGGYYSPLSYRSNDPFVFCTQGQDRQVNPTPCWIPMPPYTGAFMVMPYCVPVNPYGMQWSADDTKSFQEYLRVCPAALSSGRWEGSGRPETSPFQH